MKNKKNKAQQAEMGIEVVHGHYYVPTEIGNLFAELAQPKSNDKILRIGFRDAEPKLPNVIDFVTQTIPTESIVVERQKALDDKTFDVILCAPSFGDALGESNRPSEEIWLEWGIRHLEKGGRLIIVVPMGLLSNYSQVYIRQFLLEHANLDAIIELPVGWAAGVAISASILYITLHNEASSTIKMVQLSRLYDLPYTELVKFISGNTSHSVAAVYGKSFVVERAKLDFSRLDVKYYDPAYETIPPALGYESIKLKDLVDIRSGERFSSEKISVDGVPFIQVKNITEKMGIDTRNTKKINQHAAINSRSFCKPGDVLISTAGTIGKVAVVPQDIEVCIDTSLRQLRIHDRALILSEYLALFLRSNLAALQMERMTSGSVISVLSTPNLENITIYLPSIDKQREIIKSYEKAMQEAQNQLLGFFPEIADKRISFKSLQPTSEKKERETQEPFSSIVATRFPYPLARAYSMFINSSNDSGANRVRRLYLASEAVVYYLYGILVSDYLFRLSIADTELNALLLESIRDFSIDRRIKFITRIIKKARIDTTWNLFVPKLTDVAIDICSEIHNNVRNQFSHNETSDAWCRKQVQDYSPKLEKLFRSLLPLKEYRLVQATNIQVQNKRPQYTMIVMMGNNSIFTSQVEDFDEMLPIDTNKVILFDEDSNALELHPIYQFHAWENTGMQDRLCFVKQMKQETAVFTLESLDGSGVTNIGINIQFASILEKLGVDKPNR